MVGLIVWKYMTEVVFRTKILNHPLRYEETLTMSTDSDVNLSTPNDQNKKYFKYSYNDLSSIFCQLWKFVFLLRWV